MHCTYLLYGTATDGTTPLTSSSGGARISSRYIPPEACALLRYEVLPNRPQNPQHLFQPRESRRENEMSVLSEALEPLSNPQAADEAVAAAVQTFSEQASTSSASSIGDYLWDAFNVIFAVVGRTPPERQTRLVQFLDQLKGRTVVDAQGQPLSYEGGVVWKDLPSLGWIARDLWNFGMSLRALAMLGILSYQA